MGLLDFFGSSPFSYKDKKGTIWWLHEKDSGNGIKLYYFSHVAAGAIPMPSDRIVVESTKTGLPLLKKPRGGGG